MGRIAAIGVFLVAASPVAADDWRPVADVHAILADRTIDYDRAWQRFNASGKTLYDAGQPSWGNWAERGGQYCSEWPPADGWTCYELEVSTDGGRVRFVDERGGTTEGVFRE